MHIHILSFEGPDPYARAGGIASRVVGLARTLAETGFDTHLWFVGDPERPGEEVEGTLHLHRWCQWISRFHTNGVYDGEHGKADDYAQSLPPHLFATLAPKLKEGDTAVILAEEWHTVHAVLHLDWLLRRAGLRNRVRIFWNANNTFGFEKIDWMRLGRAATITTVSRYMKHVMTPFGVDALVIPNGLDASAFQPTDPSAVRLFRRALRDRLVLTKVARWDPDKRWLQAIDVVAELKQRGARPLLVARGGLEAHGHDVMSRARSLGLHVLHRELTRPGDAGMIEAVGSLDGADILHVDTHIDAASRRLLFRGANAVLANSRHEPFGLVGLEAMAAGGVACTGCSGEDYAEPGRNALVIQTESAAECVAMLERLRARPDEERSLRRAASQTARRYAWPEVVERNLLPSVELSGTSAVH